MVSAKITEPPRSGDGSHKSGSEVPEMFPPSYTSLPDRFWSKVEKSQDGCWLWTASKYLNGYGQFVQRNKHDSAHRVSAMDAKGDIPEGLIVLHHCDVRNCVNPDHLYYGTYSDNSKDAVRRGRRAHIRHPQGVGHGKAKLTEDDVRQIRTLHASGHNRAVLSERYGVTPQNIDRIVLFKTWRHLESTLIPQKPEIKVEPIKTERAL